MKIATKKCERCENFQCRQGKGTLGDCKEGPVEVPKKPTDWCSRFKINLKKYHVNGRKVYTRVDTASNPPEDNGSIYND